MKLTSKKKQPVKAGTLSDITNFLKGISEKLFDLFDKLGDAGMKIVEQKEVDDGHFFKLDYNGKIVGVTISSTEDESTCDVVIKPPMGSEIKLTAVSKGSVGSAVEEALKKIFNNTSNSDTSTESGDTNSSKKLKVTLNTITSATGVNVNLTAIKANYDAASAMADLETILGDDAFVAQLTEAPISFEITDDGGDSFDIEETVEFAVDDTINQLVCAAIQLWSNLKVLHWAAKGAQMHDMHYRLDDYIWAISSDLDKFGEYAVECGQLAPNPMSCCCGASLISDSGGFTAEQGYQIAYQEITKYIEVLDMLYVNFPHDFQSLLDERIRHWKKDAEYFLKRVNM